MSNLKKLLMLLFLLASPAFATTTVTGTVQNLGTGASGPATFVRFWLRGCGGNQPTVNGTAVIAPSQGGVYYFDFVANSSGQISGTLYSTRDSTGNNGGDISCAGSTLAVWYGMQVFVNGIGGPETPIHAKNGTTLDISQVTPITTNPVVPAPTGDTTYARLDGGNTPFTGGITVPALNNIQYVDCVHYSCSPDIGVGINAALAALPSSGGTVVVSLGNSIQTLTTPVTVGINQRLNFDPATVIQPSGNIGMFTVHAGGQLKGLTVSTSSLSSNILSDSIVTLTGDTYKDGQNTSVEDITINATNQLTGGGAGILLSTTTVGSGPIAFVSFRHIRINGMAIGIDLKSSGSEWINGNHFQDIEVSSAPDGYVFDAGGSIGIGGNSFVNCSFEAGTITINVPSNIGFVFENSGPILYNTFSNLQIWDTLSPFDFINNTAAGNYFEGRWDGTVTDSTAGNYYVNLLSSSAVFQAPIEAKQFVSSKGSPCTNGELALSAGWGTSPTVTAVSGTGQTCSWTITTGTTTAANPTITDTLTNALPSASTDCEMNIHGGTHTAAAGESFQQTTHSATVPAWTFNGTPTAGGTTYFVTRRCGP